MKIGVGRGGWNEWFQKFCFGEKKLKIFIQSIFFFFSLLSLGLGESLCIEPKVSR